MKLPKSCASVSAGRRSGLQPPPASQSHSIPLLFQDLKQRLSDRMHGAGQHGPLPLIPANLPEISSQGI